MQNMILAIINPKQLFLNIREDHEFVAPMIVILITVAICGTLSLWGVDRASVMEEAMEAQRAVLQQLGQTDEQIEQTLNATQSAMNVDRPGYAEIGGALIGGLLGTFIVVLLWAVYFKVIAAAMNLGGSFSDWHAFVWWTRVPLIVGAVVGLIGTFVLNPGTTSELAFLSFAYWFNLPVHPWFGTVLYAFDIISVWVIVVAGIGFSVWTEKPLVISIVVAAIPWLVLFALSIAINMALT